MPLSIHSNLAPLKQKGQEHPPWYHSTLVSSLLGTILLALSFPPIDLWPVAWIAPIPWLLLVRQREFVGWRHYVVLWVAGFLFWLYAVHWLRYPHPITHLGWLALSFYLAFYTPLFVGLTRVAVHTLHLSILLAAPLVWTGLELARAHFLTGFTMASLGHTQFKLIQLIQISDVAGGYAVSFLVMLVAASLARLLPWKESRGAIWPVLPAALAVAGTIFYGMQRLDPVDLLARGPRVAVIQGSIEADLKQDPASFEDIFNEYYQLSQQAVRQSQQPIDLIVWPETMYRRSKTFHGILFDFDPDYKDPPERAGVSQQAKRETLNDLADLAQALRTPLLLGIDTFYLQSGDSPQPSAQRYNSAIAVDRQGILISRYDKMHLVMFGEYIPLADRFPWIYNFTPMSDGLDAGNRPVSMNIEGVRYAPNVCFETVIPHLIREQVRTLQAEGEMPDVLVNVTNDAWFRGSSELDMHLRCSLFRCIECRRPMVIAANGGISALVDSNGQIIEQLPKLEKSYFVANVPLDQRESLYLKYGDLFSGSCLLFCGLVLLVGCGRRFLPRRDKQPAASQQAGEAAESLQPPPLDDSAKEVP